MSPTVRVTGPVIGLLVLFAAEPVPGQDWTVVPLGTAVDILAVENTSLSEKWIVGEGGFAAQSSVSRTVWTPVAVGTTADLPSVYQPSSGEVWVGAGGGSVRLKSGTTWHDRGIPDGTQDFDLFARDSGCSYAAGTGGAIYRTTDLGVNWTAQSSGTTAALHGGSGFVSSTAYVIGDGGTILKTTNGGTVWSPCASGTTADLYALVESPASWLTVVGEAGTVLQSTDGGATWLSRPTYVGGTLRAISSSKQNSNWLVAVGSGGTVIKSTSGGVTWCRLDAGTTADLYGVEAATNAEYIVCGADGLLLRTTNGGGACLDPTGVISWPIAEPGYRLSGPEPNPIRQFGIARVEVARAQDVRAEIIDASGRRVATLFEGRVETGSPRLLPLNAERWSPGIYFLRLSGETFAASRRIVAVR